MAVPITNFGLVTVSTTYGSGDTTITLTGGHGARLPATTGGYQYPLTWWNSTDYPQPADDPNVEIVLVTNRSTDTLTVTRGQEGTSASTKNASSKTYRMSLGITKSMWEGLRSKSTHRGLVLRTDRDMSSEQEQVELITVDSITMDDGTVMDNGDSSWMEKTANITVSGAGGLDTSSESSSAWYEIYAIAKEDGTKNLLLHKSRAWATDTSYTSGEDASQNIGAASGNQFVSQGFKVSVSGKLRYAKMKLLKVGSPTGSQPCLLYSDNAGTPGSFISSSYNIDVSTIPTTATWVFFTFPPTAPTLSASPTQYHLVIGRGVDASNYLQWRMDGSAGAYANGSKATHNGTIWTADSDDDMMFEIGIETGNSSVTMPASYTKKCHLGWVYNNGSSNFTRFIQRGRTRRDLTIEETINAIHTLDGSLNLVKLNAPPLEGCTAMMACSGTGTQAGLAAVGNTSRYDLSSVGDTTSAQTVLFSGVTSTRPSLFTEAVIEGGFFLTQGTNGAKIWVSGFSW